MEWKSELIALYCTVCQCYRSRLANEVQRLSNNCRPQFTDEEVITIYLWGTLNRQTELRRIYDLVKNYLPEWFPKLPSYQAFSRRVNDLSRAFQLLAEMWMEELFPDMPTSNSFVIDSMPIILAKDSRSDRAKVATEVCSKTYNAVRGQWYYGMKLHALGMLVSHKMPIPVSISFSPASASDLSTAREMFAQTSAFPSGYLFADKVYIDSTWKEHLANEYGLRLLTPRKKLPNITDAIRSRDTYSSYVSSRRQSIESFFHWLNTVTGIQNASKVRSLKGLLSHLFGKLAAALFSLFHS